MSLVVPLKEIFQKESGLLSKHPSWERIELGEVCDVLNGYAFKSTLFNKENGFPIIRIRDLARNLTKTFYRGEYPKEYVVSDDDLLIGMDGNFGCYEWKGGPALLNQRVCKLIPNESVLNRKFLLFSLNGYLKAIQEATSSVTVGHLSSRDTQRIPIPFPPLNEQNRIVEKLEKLLGKVDAAQNRLDKIPLILKRFRQSVLAAACSGKLTADWRTERQIQDGPDLPSSWDLTTVEEVSRIGSGHSSKRIIDLSKATGEIAWFKVGDMNSEGNEKFMTVTRTWLSKRDAQNLRLKLYPAGSIIFPKRGGAIATNKKRILAEDAAVDLNLMVLTPDPEIADFFWLWFSSVDLASLSNGSNVPQINNPDILPLQLPFPPNDEQKEIVRRVEDLFKFADQIEERYKKARRYTDKLTQSILAKAFRGELVPQDPTDEPASVLLERIKNDRTQADCTPNRRRSR